MPFIKSFFLDKMQTGRKQLLSERGVLVDMKKRVDLCRLLIRLDKNKEYCKKLGLADATMIKESVSKTETKQEV